MPGIEGRHEGRPLVPKWGAQEEGEGAWVLRPLGHQRAALTAALDAGHRGPPFGAQAAETRQEIIQLTALLTCV